LQLAEAKPVKPGILALTPKASRCWQVFWLSWFFANLPIKQNCDSGYFRQNLLSDKGLQLRGQLLIRTGFPLRSALAETSNTVAMIKHFDIEKIL
jgi:hypothetical protein